MVVIYNHLALLLAVVAGGIEFGLNRFFPGRFSFAGNIPFWLILAMLDFAYRSKVVRPNAEQPAPPNAPLSPANQNTDYWWLFNSKGAMFMFIPIWLIGVFGVTTNLVFMARAKQEAAGVWYR
jgi:hypothetical protein